MENDTDTTVCPQSNNWTNDSLMETQEAIDFWGEGVGLLLICSFGIVGNVVSIFVLTSQDIDLKPSFANILICLAVYDLLFGVCGIITYSLTHLSVYYKDYVWPWLAPYLLGVIHIALTGSVYTTIAVAVERCVTVCAPFTDIKMCGGALYIVPIVIFSIIYNITKFKEVETVAGFYEFENNTGNYTPPTIQKTEFTTPNYIATTRIANCIVMGLMPMIILAFLNYLIYRAVSKAHAHHNSITQGHAHRRDSTMATLLTGIVLVFMICHSVKSVLNIYEAKKVLELYPCEMEWTPMFRICSITSHILITLNSSMNILIYVFKDFKFRQVLRRLLCGKEEVRQSNRRGQPSMTTRGFHGSHIPLTQFTQANGTEIPCPVATKANLVAKNDSNGLIMEISKM